ncbi:MAG: amidase, partial [Actinomycetota bacterium]
DGGGSIRIPASCCGLFGIKPARGRVSHAPHLGESLAGLATDGTLARTVADAAALLDVMEGYESGDPYWAPPPERPFAWEAGMPPGRLRIGFTSAAPNLAEVDPECAAATEEAAKLLQSLGHAVEEAAPAWDALEMLPMFVRIWQAGWGAHQTDVSQLEPLNRALAEAGQQASSTDYVAAVIGISQYARRVVSFWDDYDLLLTPTLARPPVPVGWNFEVEDPWAQLARAGEFVPFTPPINITGQPAVSLPLAWTEGGLPVGVQLVGPPAGEALLVRVSAQLEEARPWSDRRPAAAM